MNAPIRRRQARKAVSGAVVLRNLLSRKEADEIVDRSIERKGPYMTLAETLAHAAQLKKEKEQQVAE